MKRSYNQELAFLWLLNESHIDVPLLFTKEAVPYTTDTNQKIPLNKKCNITEDIDQKTIHFTTTCPGVPHLIKVSYFPKWQGAKIYHVSPSFMMVVPKSNEVTLTYGPTWVEGVALLSFVIGILLLIHMSSVYSFLKKKKKILLWWPIVVLLIVPLMLMQGENHTQEIAIATAHYPTCQYARNKDACYTGVALKTFDWNLCIARVTHNKDACLLAVAKQYNETHICEYIKNNEVKQQCLAYP